MASRIMSPNECFRRANQFVELPWLIRNPTDCRSALGVDGRRHSFIAASRARPEERRRMRADSSRGAVVLEQFGGSICLSFDFIQTK
ncbi:MULTISPECIES: hypothetical protein [Burkholderia]|uniref:hypothetical protein n=1 Tax=Burkholderia TaxID=32008 RepID=UPI0011AE8E40|nr:MULTISPECIES: hypothetical protein [Burkholderia]